MPAVRNLLTAGTFLRTLTEVTLYWIATLSADQKLSQSACLSATARREIAVELLRFHDVVI
jgi:hypothetical protein